MHKVKQAIRAVVGRRAPKQAAHQPEPLVKATFATPKKKAVMKKAPARKTVAKPVKPVKKVVKPTRKPGRPARKSVKK